MTRSRTLYISHAAPGVSADFGAKLRAEFRRNKALFLDYSDLYLRFGQRGAMRFLREFIRRAGVTSVIYAADPLSYHFPPAFFAALREEAYLVLVCGDSSYYYEVRDKFYAAAFDLFCVFDSYPAIDDFRARGGDALIFFPPFDGKTYTKAPGAREEFDVSFVGAVAGRPDRAAYLRRLEEGGLKPAVFGLGTAGGPVTLERMIEIFNGSRITLNFTGATVVSRIAGNHIMPREVRQLKGRLTEAALCGAFILSETAPGLERLFRPGKELETFSTSEELLEKIRFYLANPERRKAIAEAGRRRARADYECASAVPRLLREIEDRRLAPARFRPSIPPDAPFWRDYGAYRILYTLRFLMRFSLGLALEELLLLLKTGHADLRQCYTFLVEEVVDKFPAVKNLLKRIFARGGN